MAQSKKSFIQSIILIVGGVLFFQSMLVAKEIPLKKSQQLVVVETSSWSASKGWLQRYEYHHKRWEKVGRAMAVFVGRNGLGWGIGKHTLPKGATPLKKEGDGKAPAGIFALKHAFGYAPFQTDYPYTIYHRYNHCVDDTSSRFYNNIVNAKEIKRDYKSRELMRFKKNYYEYGVVVDHNHFGTQEAIKGRGSCIFLHIKNRPTAGCTVMQPSEIKSLIRWLDAKKYPLLIQGTHAILPQLLQEVQ